MPIDIYSKKLFKIIQLLLVVIKRKKVFVSKIKIGNYYSILYKIKPKMVNGIGILFIVD